MDQIGKVGEGLPAPTIRPIALPESGNEAANGPARSQRAGHAAVAASEGQEPALPSFLECTISFEPMTKAVHCPEDGWNYQEDAIRKWISEHGFAPRSHKSAREENLSPAYAIRQAAEEWLRDNPNSSYAQEHNRPPATAPTATDIFLGFSPGMDRSGRASTPPRPPEAPSNKGQEPDIVVPSAPPASEVFGPPADTAASPGPRHAKTICRPRAWSMARILSVIDKEYPTDKRAPRHAVGPKIAAVVAAPAAISVGAGVGVGVGAILGAILGGGGVNMNLEIDRESLGAAPVLCVANNIAFPLMLLRTSIGAVVGCFAVGGAGAGRAMDVVVRPAFSKHHSPGVWGKHLVWRLQQAGALPPEPKIDRAESRAIRLALQIAGILNHQGKVVSSQIPPPGTAASRYFLSSRGYPQEMLDGFSVALTALSKQRVGVANGQKTTVGRA